MGLNVAPAELKLPAIASSFGEFSGQGNVWGSQYCVKFGGWVPKFFFKKKKKRVEDMINSFNYKVFVIK